MKLKKFIDLSWEIGNDTPIYPGDPVPSITPFCTMSNYGYNLSTIITGTQTGSHIDAPFHVSDAGLTVENLPLSLFCGKSVLIDVSQKGVCEEITPQDILPYQKAIKSGTIPLFRTDWWKYAGTPLFTQHPFLNRDSGALLIELGVSFFAIDTLNADKSEGNFFPVHDMFAKHGYVIGENMCHFDKIDFSSILFAAFPLHLKGCDGSPVRAVAMELEE